MLTLTAAHAQSSQSAPPSTSALTPIGASANLASLVRDGVKLQPPQQLDGAQVSPLRATGGPQLGDTMLCLKTMADGRTGFIAVFFEAGKVLSYRRAIAYDRCEPEPYSRLFMPPSRKAAPVRSTRAKPAAIARPLPIGKPLPTPRTPRGAATAE
jgi:hypothetical protein